MVDNRKSPVDLGDLYAYEIEDIRFAGADTALATFKCAMMGKQFTDFCHWLMTAPIGVSSPKYFTMI